METRRRLQTITKQDNSQQISYNNYQPQTTKVHPVFIETVQSLPQPSLFLTNNNNSSTEKTILTIMSNGRDRTNEFLTTVKTFQSRRNDYVRPLIPPAPSTKKTASTIQQSHQFMQSAKQIGQDLSQTFVKLEQLTIIAKQSSLFHDKSAEIQDLTSAIKQDIGNLNKQIAQLQQYMHSTNGIKSKNSQTHSNSVVFVLQSKLAIMSNDFKQVLEARTHNLKEQKSRRDNFSKNTVASAGHPISMNGRPSLLLRDDKQANGDSFINMGSAPSQNYSQKQLQITDETDTYLASRSEAMQNIEQTIIELGDIFTQLSTIVTEQQELVDRIDANVDDAAIHIEGAHGELLKFYRTVTSNRWLIIKVFAVLIICFLLFIIFLA